MTLSPSPIPQVRRGVFTLVELPAASKGFTLVELPAASKGFTLVELIVTMSIIIILIGMGVVGFKIMGQQGRTNDTKVALANLAAMMTEMETAAKGTRPNVPQWVWDSGSGLAAVDPAVAPESGYDLNFWKAPWRDPPGPTGEPQPLPAPGSVITGKPDRDGLTGGVSPAGVLNTVRALAMLQGNPTNKRVVQGLPPEKLMRVSANNADTPYDDAQIPILLDGWANPIIFVPSSGLGHDSGSTAGKVLVGGVYKIITSPDGKPFWASAGEDGDFQTGDDNVYSFEN
jgi:prepilin-type N-terminal cleavage/methylation domain-containing protein